MTRRVPLCCLLIVVPLFLQGCVFHIHDGGRYHGHGELTDSRFSTLDIGDATEVRVRAGAGSLRIEGYAGGQLRASGTAHATSASDLERVSLAARRVGSSVVIETDAGGWSDGRRRLDLLVEVPDWLPVVVDDDSGSVEIYNVAAVELRDGSGSIHIDGVAGDVRVVDGSGGIDIRAVQGTVVIASDGSGGIDIVDVGVDVIVEEDGSGGINVVNVGRDFVVDRDGSGGVRHRGVRGIVDVPSD